MPLVLNNAILQIVLMNRCYCALDDTRKLTQLQQSNYTPSPQMTDRLRANRQGKLTDAQRAPILAAALISSVGLFVFGLIALITIGGFIATLGVTGVLGWLFMTFTALSFFFLIVVLWTNAEMFVPEALSRNPIRWERGKLKIKLASRDRPEMPFSYIVGDYSFAPFLPPQDVPMEKGREYLVYYTVRSRLLLSIVPTDVANIKDYLPEKN